MSRHGEESLEKACEKAGHGRISLCTGMNVKRGNAGRQPARALRHRLTEIAGLDPDLSQCAIILRPASLPAANRRAMG